jgi:hypothetical protein
MLRTFSGFLLGCGPWIEVPDSVEDIDCVVRSEECHCPVLNFGRESASVSRLIRPLSSSVFFDHIRFMACHSAAGEPKKFKSSS